MNIPGTATNQVTGLPIDATYGAPNPAAQMNPQQYLNSLGLPTQAPFVEPFDMSTLTTQLNGIPIDMSGINAYRDQALRTGPSTWANLSKAQIAAQEANAKEQAQQSSSGQTASVLDNLAANGGLSSGARERAYEAGAKDLSDTDQNLTRNANLNDMQVGINDESNRIAQLGQLPGMENAAIQPLFEKSQIYTNAEGENNQALNAFNMQQSQLANNAYAANQQANATQAAGNGGSSFICTALRAHGLMTNRETKKMLSFMLKNVVPRADFFAWYFQHGSKAIAKAEDAGFKWADIKKEFVTDIIWAIEHDSFELAQELYATRAGKFVEAWSGEKFDKKLIKGNKFKALLSIPVVLSLPGTWKWAFEYFKPRLMRRVRLAKYGFINMMPRGL